MLYPAYQISQQDMVFLFWLVSIHLPQLQMFNNQKSIIVLVFEKESLLFLK
jgi:hypothetical protein